MKLRRNLTAGLSKIEVLVIMAVAGFFVCLAALGLLAARGRARSMCCNCNLKQIGLSMVVWAGDHYGNNPMQISVTNGGTKELIATGQVFSTLQVMSNELSTPFILVCPEDKARLPAKSFITNFDDRSVSYFLGLDASNSNPQMFLSGDPNLSANNSPLSRGLYELTTNSTIGWTKEFHKYRGNIGLSDGSVQILSSQDLNAALANTGLPTNRFAIP